MPSAVPSKRQKNLPAPTAQEADEEKPGIALTDAVAEVSDLIDEAIEFKVSFMEPDWATAERYYNGFTDLEEFEGRSNVTKTEVRDAIRNMLPSIMRILFHSRKPVGYKPSSVTHAMWVDQQAEYACDIFVKNNGYMTLYQAILEALKLKIGPIKTWWESNPEPEFFRYTAVPMTVVEQLIDDPLTEVSTFEQAETQLGEVEVYNVTGYRLYENGRIISEAVPNYEFFISQNCNSIEMALEQGVHGHQRIITVAQAMAMGLEYDSWLDLDFEDPETNNHQSSSQERRKYQKKEPNSVKSKDVLKHQFLLTEAYVKYDMEDEGHPQVYKFLLGGTNYTYLHHEQVDDSPYALVIPIPIQFTAYGHSVADLTITEQDTSTSILRATVDNAHAANNVKIAADPQKTNFEDLLNPAINAPIRKRSGDTLQTVQIPSTAQAMLGVLGYLDQDIQNKIGITKAAQGLDPDALQSTDKDAVLNTIMTAQGQTELMVRNIVETGLIRLFRILLKLTVRHQSPIQMMQVKGKVIPVDTRMFDVDAVAYPNVGLGTASPLQKQSALSFIYQEQKMAMKEYGPNNPFTSYAQMYNTLEDMLEANGIYNVERYFNIVTPGVEKQWAEAQEKAKQEMAKQQAENAPMDPSKAFMQVEQGKREVETLKAIGEQRDKERQRALQALIEAEKADLERDKMDQNRIMTLLELGQEQANAEIEAQQQSNDAKSTPLKKGAVNGTRPKPSLSAGGSGGSQTPSA